METINLIDMYHTVHLVVFLLMHVSNVINFYFIYSSIANILNRFLHFQIRTCGKCFSFILLLLIMSCSINHSYYFGSNKRSFQDFPRKLSYVKSINFYMNGPLQYYQLAEHASCSTGILTQCLEYSEKILTWNQQSLNLYVTESYLFGDTTIFL